MATDSCEGYQARTDCQAVFVPVWNSASAIHLTSDPRDSDIVLPKYRTVILSTAFSGMAPRMYPLPIALVACRFLESEDTAQSGT